MPVTETKRCTQRVVTGWSEHGCGKPATVRLGWKNGDTQIVAEVCTGCAVRLTTGPNPNYEARR